jgi:hypothetical protein
MLLSESSPLQTTNMPFWKADSLFSALVFVEEMS